MATASLVKWLYFSGAQDETGAPIASGTATFYQPGSTSVQITVYSDAAATATIAQPVPLDAGGRAEVFIKTNCEIKVIDAAGVQKRLTVSAESVESGQVHCTYGSSPVTLDAALTSIEASLSVVTPDVPVATSNLETVSTASPSFAFDATKELNVFVATYAGAVGALTITAVLGGATVNSKYRIAIQTGALTTATSTVFPASFVTSTPPTTLDSAKYYVAEFIAVNGPKLAQCTPWIVATASFG